MAKALVTGGAGFIQHHLHISNVRGEIIYV